MRVGGELFFSNFRATKCLRSFHICKNAYKNE
nr:MAG TPA: hypothetical protein [Caudoviricetes sp.]